MCYSSTEERISQKSAHDTAYMPGLKDLTNLEQKEPTVGPGESGDSGTVADSLDQEQRRVTPFCGSLSTQRHTNGPHACKPKAAVGTASAHEGAGTDVWKGTCLHRCTYV